MPFQFQCPNDHLLEGDESQAGQAINCPVCGLLFIIPEPVAVPTAEPAPVPETPPEPELLHIPCPNGHELEVPPEMLDTEVLCPRCNAQFLLRARDSIEHRRRREQEQALRDAKTNKFYYQFAIVVASVVALLLLTLMIMSMVNKSEPVDNKPMPRKQTKGKKTKSPASKGASEQAGGKDEPESKPKKTSSGDEEPAAEEMKDQ